MTLPVPQTYEIRPGGCSVDGWGILRAGELDRSRERFVGLVSLAETVKSPPQVMPVEDVSLIGLDLRAQERDVASMFSSLIAFVAHVVELEPGVADQRSVRVGYLGQSRDD